MNPRVPFVAFLVILVTSGSVPAKPPEQALSAGAIRKSGTVRMEISCAPEVKDDFQTALALLHSFFYDEARRQFVDIAGRDPGCAMAWWGAAMTWYHPLWAPPTAEDLAEGIAMVEKARALGGKSDLERGLIAAIDAYFRSEDGPALPGPVAQSCHGPRAHGARAEAFRAALGKLREEHPDSLEVTVFYTLALLATAPPTDKSYTNQLMATAILEPLFERNPDHPAIPHYIIHAYDYPSLAARGLVAARQYGDVAPWVPHALHMPSHIYTRLGMWGDSVEANLASAAAARDYTGRVHGGGMSHEELHALDYAVFAYLQTAQDRKAGEIVDRLQGPLKFLKPDFAAAYALGAIPARHALERRRWKDAAALVVQHPEAVGPFPFAAAHTEFARAVGAARSGQAGAARTAVKRLADLRDALKEPKFKWWIDQIEIQRLAAAGWLARAEGQDDEALRLLRESAALEDRAGTHPVTPGQILPAHEQLGDLLMDLGRPAEALVEYEKSLEAFPNRFNGHAGAGLAAERAGKHAAAREHYARLVDLGRGGDGRREIVANATRYLAAPSATAQPRDEALGAPAASSIAP